MGHLLPFTKEEDLCGERVGGRGGGRGAVVVGGASCFLWPGINVWLCGAVAGLTEIYNGEIKAFLRFSTSLSGMA